MLVILTIALGVIEEIPALFILIVMLSVFLGRYMLWNFYGKENLVINTKTISYQFDYGFFKTNYVMKPFINKSLYSQTFDVINEKDVKYVKLAFYSYNHNDFPVEVYRMALHITDREAERLDLMIRQMYLDKISEAYSLPVINLN